MGVIGRQADRIVDTVVFLAYFRDLPDRDKARK
jgi:hypothetical protein